MCIRDRAAAPTPGRQHRLGDGPTRPESPDQPTGPRPSTSPTVPAEATSPFLDRPDTGIQGSTDTQHAIHLTDRLDPRGRCQPLIGSTDAYPSGTNPSPLRVLLRRAFLVPYACH